MGHEQLLCPDLGTRVKRWRIHRLLLSQGSALPIIETARTHGAIEFTRLLEKQVWIRNDRFMRRQLRIDNASLAEPATKLKRRQLRV